MNHPSEKELQQYILEKDILSSETINHIDNCAFCKESVSVYAVLFTEISGMPIGKFNFNLNELVLPQLAEDDSNRLAEKIIVGFLIFFIGSFIAIPVLLFHRNIMNIFNGIPAFFLYAIALSSLFILLFMLLQAYKKFRSQMQSLNFS